MKLLDKILPLSLSVAGLALALAASPVNAQSFQIGNKEPSDSTGSVLGQSFDISIGSSFATYSGNNAYLNYIKFLYNVTDPSDALVNQSVKLLIYSSLPTISDIKNATGSIVAISDVEPPTTLLNDPDFSVSGNVSRQFNFSSSSPELAINTTYYAFFSFSPIDTANTAPQSLRTNSTAQSFYGNSYDGSRNAIQGDANFIAGLTPVPFEFEASGGIAILGGLFAVHKLRQRKQNNSPDEQPDNPV